MAEQETIDILDRALLKAKHDKEQGMLGAPEYHRIYEKVYALKKLKFAESYEYH